MARSGCSHADIFWRYFSLYFFSLLPAGCGWTQCRSLIALLFFCGSPRTQPRTHTKIPPEGKTLVFYLWMWAARGEKPVPRSTVSEAGNGEASLTSINLLSFHPSALSISHYLHPSPLLSSVRPAFFFFFFSSASPLLRMSSSLFDLNVRCKGHSHHAALHYHCGFLASAKNLL